MFLGGVRILFLECEVVFFRGVFRFGFTVLFFERGEAVGSRFEV